MKKTLTVLSSWGNETSRPEQGRPRAGENGDRPGPAGWERAAPGGQYPCLAQRSRRHTRAAVVIVGGRASLLRFSMKT